MIWPFKRKQQSVESRELAVLPAIESKFGAFEDSVRASIPHLLMGGHVDLRSFANETGWMTVDVHALPDFPASADGHHYELFSLIDRPHPEISALLTVLVRHFASNLLQDGDRVLVSEIAGLQAKHPWVKINLFDVGSDGIAAYQVVYDEEQE